MLTYTGNLLTDCALLAAGAGTRQSEVLLRNYAEQQICTSGMVDHWSDFC